METIEILVIQHGNMFKVAPGQPTDPEILMKYAAVEFKCPGNGLPYSYTGKMPTKKVGTKSYAQCNASGHTIDPYGSTAK